MRLTVNGESISSDAGTVEELLRELKIDPVRVAVEVNLAVIKKAEYAAVRLNEGDAVEIVNFVAGG